MLEIKALGNLVITKDGKSIGILGSLRAQVILTYLALEGGSHHRSYLAAMFWPESNDEKALNSLRGALTELRKGVGEYLRINRSDVSLNLDENVYLDVFDLEKLIKLGKTDQVLTLYRGDFLTGIYIPGSVEFENWRRWESERIKILVTEYLEGKIKNRISLSHYQESEVLSLNLLKIDPTNETANQNYPIALAMSGHRSTAVKHLESYKKNLREELGLEPSREFSEIEEWILKGDLNSLDNIIRPRSNLPYQQTCFIGRVDSLSRMTELLTNKECRLINIVGAGGIGKTRLAIKSIKANIQHFPDGAYYVPLDTVTSREGILQAIAEAIDFQFDSVISLISPQTQLLDVIGDSRIIILLDGFEHLTESGSLISLLLNRAPNLKILLTSRHKLNIPGEWVHILGGLNTESASDPNGDLPDALQLLISRSEQNNPGIIVGDEDLGPAINICKLVDGLPLGIELAAGWTSVLSLAEIANGISSTYEFLDRQTETNEPHRGIKAVFSSSWNLLENTQQELMARLSVFQGGFSQQAAKQVVNATLTDLSALLDKSMLQKKREDKFVIHPVLHEFCQDIQFNRPQDLNTIRHRHFQYYDEFLSSRAPMMYTLDENCTHLEIKRELPNILGAAEFSIINHEKMGYQRIIKNLFSYYIIHGWYEGGLAFKHLVEFLEELQSHNQGNYSKIIAQINSQRGFFYSNLGLLEESEKICRASLPLLKDAQEVRELAICIQNLGINAIFRGDFDQAISLLDQAINISNQTSCSSFPSFYLWVGYLHFLLGNYQEGMKSLRVSLELFEQDNNVRGTAYSFSKMGLAQDGLGNFQEASRYHEKALRIFRESDNQAGQGYALSRMSLGALLLKDYPSADQFGREALTKFTKIGHRWGKCASLSRIAYAKLGLGKIPESRKLFLEALSIAYKHELDPLCLHALAGIACVRTASGKVKDGQTLMKYIFSHPKTPEIYITVTRDWFKIDKLKKSDQKKQISDPELSIIAGNILENNQ